MIAQLRIDQQVIAAFCQKWQIAELALFGSALREDFRDESDVDVLVTFFANASWSAFEIVTMTRELEAVFGRPVDVVEKSAITNPYRRAVILKTCEVIHAA